MRFIAWIVAGLLVLVILGGGVGYVYLSTSLPRTAGLMRLKGIADDVVIARDEFGVPRIVAQSAEDAYFALGYVHAQDRLWQMEWQRRVGQGRLSELVGATALPVDKFMRTLGLYHLAEYSAEHLAPATRRALEAYSAGVNAYIASRGGVLPPEFLLLRTTPEPWKPADSLVWGRLMGLQLSLNWYDELLRARAAKTLPPDQLADLFAAYPADQPVTIAAMSPAPAAPAPAPAISPAAVPAAETPAPAPAAPAPDVPAPATPAPDTSGQKQGAAPADPSRELSAEFLDRMIEAIPAPAMPRLASNEWVVAGNHTASGKPLLANDPHLDYGAPILWYLASIVSPDLTVAGATVPGVPYVVLGHNERIAWGMTTTSSDTMDLYIEKPEGSGYLTPDGPRPFDLRNETIRVRGQASVQLAVRETRHGPIVSDILGDRADGQLLAVSAAFLRPEDTTVEAIHLLNRARNWDEFTAALAKFDSPQQNVSYADVDGNIGLIAPGKVPIRKAGDGTMPMPGWTGDNDWTGWIPYQQLPRTYDPPSGLIVNANNKLVGDEYKPLLTVNWPDGYRARRILDLLGQRTGLTANDMSAIQMDSVSAMALDLKPLMLRAAPIGPRATAARILLQAWDGRTDRHRPETLIFDSWIGHLQRDLLDAWLGSDAKEFGSPRPLFLKRVLTDRRVWCTPPGKPPPENCDKMVAQALAETIADLTRDYGEDMSAWRWGEAHRVVFDPLLFGRIPVIDDLTRIEAPADGDWFTVNRGGYATHEMDRYPDVHGPGVRAVYDLADPAASRFVIATGQSGNPLSDHWDDLLGRWLSGGWFSEEASRLRPDVLTLAPSP